MKYPTHEATQDCADLTCHECESYSTDRSRYLQEEVLHWGPNFFSQNGTQPLVYVAVLLMSQHFGHAVQYMGSQAELKDHGAHLAIACNHLKVAPCLLEYG